MVQKLSTEELETIIRRDVPGFTTYGIKAPEVHKLRVRPDAVTPDLIFLREKYLGGYSPSQNPEILNNTASDDTSAYKGRSEDIVVTVYPASDQSPEFSKVVVISVKEKKVVGFQG